MADWHVYILECADHTLYTGVTNDLPARTAAHNAGRGAKYTRSRLPVTLIYHESAENRAAALKREYAIKQMRVAEKRGLIEEKSGI